MVLHQVTCHTVDLEGQLAGGRDDNGTRAVAWHELCPVQQLRTWDEVGQCLARACACVCGGEGGHVCVRVCEGEGMCVHACAYVRVCVCAYVCVGIGYMCRVRGGDRVHV